MMNIHNERYLAILLGSLTAQVVALILLSSVATAQSTNASLSVLVVDPSGGAVPAADVAVTSRRTGQSIPLRTSQRGLARAANLAPGVYAVRAEADGFAPTEVGEVVLNVNDQSQIRVELQLASTSEQITVVESVNEVQVSPAVQSVVNRQFVENLPLNGRSFQSLIALNPGVVQAPSAVGDPGQFSVNGQRTNSNYFTVDGVSANFAIAATPAIFQSAGGTLPAMSAQGGTNALVSVDAMQEFKVQTSSYAPEFGRSPGGQIAVATRSGRNDFHGSLFEYFRNDALDANDWFANRDGLEKPPLRQNDFGGVLGGPIVKNRSFFFVSHESLRLRQPRFATSVFPTIEARETAPESIQPFVNAFPIPNREQVSETLGRFAATFSNPSSLDATSFRIDHQLSDTMTLFGRYNYAPSSIAERGADAFGSVNTVTTTDFDIQTLTLGSTQILSPLVTNDLRFNYSENDARAVFSGDPLDGAVIPSNDFLFPSFTSPEEALVGVVNLAGPGFAAGVTADNGQSQFHAVDNFAIVRGAHQLKLGADFRRMRPLNGPPSLRYFGVFNGFDGRGGLLSGFPLQTLVESRETVGMRIDNWSFYAQDAWNLAPRVTLTYGFRWDYNPAPTGRDGKQLFTATNLENPAQAALSAPGADLYDPSVDNFAPRVGIAWQLNDRSGRETILRGGFGLFYDMSLGIAANALNGAPYRRSVRFRGEPFPLAPEQVAPVPFTTEPPYFRLDVLDPAIDLPLTYQWNVALEQSLGESRTLTASYVASAGRGLLRTEQYARPNDAIQTLNVGRNDAESDYHSLQTKFVQRLSKGVQAMASYTWAHSIDTASSDTIFTVPTQDLGPEINRGSSDFDLRHNLSGALTYELPEPALRGLAKRLARGWAVDTIFRAQSAFPVDVFQRRVVGAGQFDARPDLVAGQPLEIEDDRYAGGRILNPAAFVSPEEPRQGILGRNSLRGFPLRQIDLTVRRRFAFGERVGLQFRVEIFNLFNNPSFANPVGNLQDPLFGRAARMFGRGLGSGGQGGGLNPLYQIGGPRSVQLALKLTF